MEELGGYRLIEELGAGGMGVVHLAVDGQNNPVAVKVLHPHIAHDSTARQRLAREVRTLRRIRHPRIAEVLDAELDAAQPFIVTEFVDGTTLSDDVREHGPFSEDELVHFGHALLDALSAVHSAGVIHRDLKPANVMIMDGEPMVIDFGIAQVADEVRVTATGLVMGTPGYLSPEIADGKASSEKTDWWGWAATMAFAATGRNPYGSGPLEAVLSRVALGRANLEGAPPRFVPLLRACLDPKPERRPSSAMILDALVDIESGRTPLMGGQRTRQAGFVDVAPPEAPTRVQDAVPQHNAQWGGDPRGRQSAQGTTQAPQQTHVSPLAHYGGLAASAAPVSASAPANTAGPGAHQATGYPTTHAGSQPGDPVHLSGQNQPNSQRPYADQQRRDHVRSGPVGYGALGIDARQPSPPQGQQLGQQPGVPAYPGAGGMAPQGQVPQGHAPHGQMAHSGPVDPAARSHAGWAVFGLVVLGCAVAPLIPLILLGLAYVWQIFARTAGGIRRSRMQRAWQYGPGAGGGWKAAPGGFFTALFTSAVCLILPVIAAVAVAVLVRLDIANIIPAGVSEEASLWGAAVAGAAVLWWGPGSKNLRYGSASIMSGAVRHSVTGVLIVALALCAIAVLAVLAVGGGAYVTWWPLPTNPFTWLPESQFL